MMLVFVYADDTVLESLLSESRLSDREEGT